MLSFSAGIIEYIVKYYNINRAEAILMVEDEWDYIEQEFVAGNDNTAAIVSELITIYMVA